MFFSVCQSLGYQKPCLAFWMVTLSLQIDIIRAWCYDICNWSYPVVFVNSLNVMLCFLHFRMISVTCILSICELVTFWEHFVYLIIAHIFSKFWNEFLYPFSLHELTVALHEFQNFEIRNSVFFFRICLSRTMLY